MSAREPIPIGLSPCPNDTFMFHAWLSGAIESAPAVAPWFGDIEELNRRAMQLSHAAPLALSKFSAAVLPAVAEHYRICSAGAALGRGCGPLIVRRADSALRGLADLRAQRIAIPGRYTTAALLLRAFGPRDVEPVEMRFDRILDAVAAGDVAAGVIIHESRFTYRDHGLDLLADLGEAWEGASGLPLPLGVIGVHRAVADPGAWQAAMRESVERALATPVASAAFVAAHAQELAPDVAARHIELYVNAFSVELGAEGRQAIEELLARAGEQSPRLCWIDP